ncbi:23S rRNA (pseudouridine(1915)-N(3))-methyltransferase RlmH [Candidatus Saccharibacteria bacterium]|nr:23S rRNA (pseudouridine(1915)-N(3))-methyltransferase RlmH [Candidatus Saccharibacteria bacterium]
MMIKIIAGGKKSKDWIKEGQAEYEKRLKKPYDVHFDYYEDAKIAAFASNWPFKADEYVILLDERGQNISSPELASRLENAFNSSKKVVFIIGDAFGVSPEIREKSDFIWSFSNLVFPHELMRIMLTEQIYRAQEINRGGKYHHV